MQVQPNTLVNLCLGVVVNTLDRNRALVPTVKIHMPPDLQPRIVARATESSALLVHLIEAGFACHCIDLSDSEKTGYILNMLATREQQPSTIILSGKRVSKKMVLAFAQKCGTLRALTIYKCKWADADFLNKLSEARPELHSLVLLGVDADVTLREKAAARWKQLKRLALEPTGSIALGAVKILFNHGNLEELCCNRFGDREPCDLPVCSSLRLLHVPYAHFSAPTWLRILFECPNIESVQPHACLTCIDSTEIDRQLEALGTKVSPVQFLDLSLESWGHHRVVTLLARCPKLKTLALDCCRSPVDEIVSLLHRHYRPWPLHHLTLWHVNVNDALLEAIAKCCPMLRRLEFPCNRWSYTPAAWQTLKRMLNFTHEVAEPINSRLLRAILSRDPILDS